jgi:tetratricopeptide (TPR) repeat protein
MNNEKTKSSIISTPEDINLPCRTKSLIKNQINPALDQSTDVSGISQIPKASSRIQHQITQNYIVVWLNINTKNSNTNVDDSINKLQHVVNSVDIFTDSNQCIDFLTDVRDEKILLIIFGSHIHKLVSLIEDIPQLHFIYVFDCQQTHNEQCAQECSKIKGVFNHIDFICEALKYDISRLLVDLTPFSIVSTTSSTSPDELDQSFMYTQLIKEIIIEIEYDDDAKQQFVDFYLNNYAQNDNESTKLNQFQLHYKDHSLIWWYTKESFIYSLLNKALRIQDTEIIIKMAFFLHDLHQKIEQKYSEERQTTKLVVYRGQGVSETDFEKINKNKGGLFSFNSFLSTSTDRDFSFMFADNARQNPDLIGILFRMEIDPSISSTPYVSVRDTSYFKSEQETLFSMHTIFRIGEMNRIDDRLWEVSLILTSDNDLQLKSLTDCIRAEIGGVGGWFRMALLMQKLGKFDKALEIYNSLLQTMSNGDPQIHPLPQAIIYGGIGELQRSMGNYSTALVHAEKTLKVFEKELESNHPFFSSIYITVALSHESIGNYATSLSYFKKALQIKEKLFSSDFRSLALLYNHIGLVHQSMGNYSFALMYCEKALEIWRKSLPSNHPGLGICCSNIGVVHQSMGNYSFALSYFHEALKIGQKSLPPNHPDLAAINNNIGISHQWMGNYPSSLAHYEKALQIWEKLLSPGHSSLATTNINIGTVYYMMRNYSSALPYYEKALSIQQNSLPPNHPDVAICYQNIGVLLNSLGSSSSALSHFEQALRIIQISLPPEHPHLAICYINIGEIYRSLGDYPTALAYFERALSIQQKSLPFNHPDIAKTHYFISAVSHLTENDLCTLSNTEKVFEIQQKHISNNKELLGSLSHNPESMYQSLEYGRKAMLLLTNCVELQQKSSSPDRLSEASDDNSTDETQHFVETYWTAISNFEKMLEIGQQSPAMDEILFGRTIDNSTERNQVYESMLKVMSLIKRASTNSAVNHNYENNNNAQSSMDDYISAFLYLDKALEIQQKFLSPNDPSIPTYYNNNGNTLCSIGQYQSALSYFEKALEIMHKSFPNNHPLLAKTYSNMTTALDGLERYNEAINYARRAVEIAHSSLGIADAETKAYEDQLHQLEEKIWQ